MLKTKLNYDTLLQASLRWRLDRIILGEVRGEEARTLLDSFNTGLGGSMATIHANSPVKALRRLGDLAMRSHQQSQRDDLAAEIADSVDYVIQIKRCPTGRKVSDVIQITGFNRERRVYECDTTYSMTSTNSLLPTTLGGN
jgi:pilus assembly protein CpaF